MTDPLRCPCGCVNEVHAPSGVLRSVTKCPAHRRLYRDPVTLDGAYYAELGLLTAEGRLAETRHVAELEEALGAFPQPTVAYPWALEIGCGVSPYVGAIGRVGYAYLGVEPSRWAAQWMRSHWKVSINESRIEDFFPQLRFSLILAAHSLEHMDDAPAMIQACSEHLHAGGELWIVVPDDSDPVNPDHMWFFDYHSLRRCLESAGLAVEYMAIRKYVPQEHFIYARARKP